MDMQKIHESVFNKMALFSTVSKNTIQKLKEEVRVCHFSKGEYVIRDREVTDLVYIVLSGKVSVYKLSENGEKRIIFILDQGHILNDDLVQNLPSAVNCECFEECCMLAYEKAMFIKLMQTDFELTKAVLGQYSSKLRRTYRQLKNAPTNIAMEKKIAAKLYRLCHDYGIPTSDGYVIDIPLSVVYLSQLVGAQRETVSRALKKLIDAGLVRYEHKKIYISDLKALGDYHKTK